MQERKRFVRLDERIDVRYIVPSSGVTKTALTKDISGGGIRLFASQPLASGTQVQAALQFPDREAPVHFTGEVVWSEQHETVDRNQRQRLVEIGLRFAEIAPADRHAVMQHIADRLCAPAPTA